MKQTRILVYDTTLRDGAQGERVSFSVEDMLRVARRLDDLGFAYIEGGWPGANPKAVEFFTRARKLKLKQAKLAAFGSTRHAKHRPAADPNLTGLLAAKTPVVTIFGKAWDLHVREALRVPLPQNLTMITDSVAHLKAAGREVLFDAEHFFDGFAANPAYALAALRAALDGGADWLVLCETNGGALPHTVAAAVRAVRETFPGARLGMHAHNDSDCAVANSLAAVREGCTQVQGTVNGYGERCGNANLCSIIPNLQLKMNCRVLSTAQLARLTDTSRLVSELANLAPNRALPYVGSSAFAHKAGIHVSAVQRHPETYEHIRPELVGNRQRVLVSDQSGRSNLVHKARELGIALDGPAGAEKLGDVLQELKELEASGYQFEGAEASFALMLRRALGTVPAHFALLAFRVINEKQGDGVPYCEATIKVSVGERVAHTAAEGDGPVNALDNALRKALAKFYPALRQLTLTDYKVRVLNEKEGTAARVRVLMEFSDGERTWGTVGCSTNIVEASWQALVDGFDYFLCRRGRH